MHFSLFLSAKVWRTHVKCFARTISFFQETTQGECLGLFLHHFLYN